MQHWAPAFAFPVVLLLRLCAFARDILLGPKPHVAYAQRAAQKGLKVLVVEADLEGITTPIMPVK
jgi:hypothetical protein